MKSEENILIKTADPRTPAIQELITELDAYQASLYPPESNHLEPVEKLVSPDYYFIAAWNDHEVLGIASFRRMPENYVEIKRLYVPHQNRSMGLAKKLMNALEEKATQEGFSEARLETGIDQKEALGLYQTLGYDKTEPFGSYQEDPLSVFMRKKLSWP
jgi:putative acetyltransferase